MEYELSKSGEPFVPSYEAIKKIVDASAGLSPNASFVEHRIASEEQIKSFEAQEALLRLQAERHAFDNYHALRKQWAAILRNLLYGMVSFEVLLTASVGLGWLKFPNQVFLDLIVGQTFLQIVGMCYIVVKFLFPSAKSPFEAAKPDVSQAQNTTVPPPTHSHSEK